jgi:hypothetical protein
MKVGDMVYFWTGRGSHGYATIRETKPDPNGDRYLLDPEPDATMGGDRSSIKWAPRDRGVLKEQIDTPPKIWWKNF